MDLGRSFDEYRSPLFLAWQLTNKCEARCLACCEESGPDKSWPDELTHDESLDLARQAVALGIPYVAFGGGEPLAVPFCWDIFEILAAAGTAIKLETNGLHIDDRAADRIAELGIDCVQISVDGATAETHLRQRPGGSFTDALDAIDRLTARGIRPQMVFVPTRLNLAEMLPAFDLAVAHGCGAFVTGPLMRLGRAALAWESLAPDPREWEAASDALRRHAAAGGTDIALSIYPWDILTELEQRLQSPQAMLLVVPNGKVKLLNALPFAAADLRRCSLADAWTAYQSAWRSKTVRDFIADCRASPRLLTHANETWAIEPAC